VGRASQRFDRQLFTDKLKELSDQMQAKSVASDRKASVASRETGGSLLLNIVDGQLALLNEWVGGVDRVARGVWEIQCEAITPEFVRDVLLPEAITIIESRRGTVMSSLSLAGLRRHDAVNLHPAQHHLVMELNKLKARVKTRYEIEARELEHRNAPIQPRIAIEPGRLKAEENQTDLRWTQADPRPMKRVSEQESMRRSAAQRIGRNIDKLRRECGWSFDNLADETGIDKKLVLDHVHGKHKPNPKTLREYAQAFTRNLHRSITANNLEE